MADQSGAPTQTNDSAESTMTQPYRLVGDFYLKEPSQYLDPKALARLRELEPFLRRLENKAQPGVQGYSLPQFDMLNGFTQFIQTESQLWNPPRDKRELVMPSGSLSWPIAHHLHNPSFTTTTPQSAVTADPNNPCTWLIMANSYEPGKTLVFDHLARREVDDGLICYPANILSCHENWLNAIRDNMSSHVEVVYGRAVEVRARKVCDLEPLALWGEHTGIQLYLDWHQRGTIHQRLRCITMFAVHTQNFCFPWGQRNAVFQDRILWIAHKIARLSYNGNFYQKLTWTFVHRFAKMSLYPEFKDLAAAAHKAVVAQQPQRKRVQDTKASNRSVAIRPGTWNASKSKSNAVVDRDVNSFLRFTAEGERGLQLDAETAASVSPSKLKFSSFAGPDPSKPHSIEIQCSNCGLVSHDTDPRWYKMNGSYVTKRKHCQGADGRVLRVFTPVNPAIKYVSEGCIWIKIYRAKKPDFRSDFLADSKNLREEQIEECELQPPDLQTHLANPLVRPDMSIDQHVTHRAENTAPGKHFSQCVGVDKGPFETWHGRKVVLSSQGRVKLWYGTSSNRKSITLVQFSAYGSYLQNQEEKFISFDERGISLKTEEREVLWQRDIVDFNTRKDSELVMKQWKHELEMQRKAEVK